MFQGGLCCSARGGEKCFLLIRKNKHEGEKRRGFLFFPSRHNKGWREQQEKSWSARKAVNRKLYLQDVRDINKNYISFLSCFSHSSSRSTIFLPLSAYASADFHLFSVLRLVSHFHLLERGKPRLYENKRRIRPPQTKSCSQVEVAK